MQVDSSEVQVDSNSRRKRIIFLRHGESEWNEVRRRAGGRAGGAGRGERLFPAITCVGGGVLCWHLSRSYELSCLGCWRIPSRSRMSSWDDFLG